jgi:hypothetical protein
MLKQINVRVSHNNRIIVMNIIGNIMKGDKPELPLQKVILLSFELTISQ